MFGYSLQGVRVPNIWTLKLKSGSFFWKVMAFWRVLDLDNWFTTKLLDFLSIFSNPPPSFYLLLAIGLSIYREGLRLPTNQILKSHVMVWLDYKDQTKSSTP